MTRSGVAALMLCASAAGAETRMTAAEFEAWSTGKTLDYWIGGAFFGSEMHLPGRKTIDSDPGGPCVAGTWFADGDAICFVYDGSETQHCWGFWHDGGGVLARSLVDDPASGRATVTLSADPLACPGPQVGS